MRCSTCGETVRDGEGRCPTCGSVVASRPVPVSYWRLRQCSRCGYRGDPIPYFRKAGNIGLLVGISAFTYGRRRPSLLRAPTDPRSLPQLRRRIGSTPGNHAPTSRKRRPPSPPRRPNRSGDAAGGPGPAHGPALGSVPAAEAASQRGGQAHLRRRAGGLGHDAHHGRDRHRRDGARHRRLGVRDGRLRLFLWGWKALQRRRQAVLQGLNRKVLVLATQRGGVLTVTEVAAELNLSLPSAEKIMNGMDDGFRVRSDISKEGIIYYEFPEVRHQKALRAGSEA